MKQTFIHLLTPLMVILSAATSVFGANVEYRGIYYNKIGNELSVTYCGSWYGEYDEYKGDIIIPQEVPIDKTMYKVTSIGECAFSECSSLKSVSIPNSVNIIGEDAFSGCSSLESVSIPNSVTIIGEDAFSRCRSLNSVSIPNSVIWIGDFAFYECSALESIEIPNRVTYIKDGTFNGCKKLASINIPSSITTIGNYAFNGCSALESIEIPNSVNFIGSGAFYGCDSLKSIEIPKNVNIIGAGAFSGCDSLTKVVFDDGTSDLEILDLDNDMNVDYDIFEFSPLEEVYLGRNLGHGAIFAGQKKLKKVTIGNTVTKIVASNFRDCTSLESVSIPNSVNIIGEDAFSGCSSLESVSIPNSVTIIGEDAFYGCSSLESVSIPNSVTWIGDRAFYECSALESLLLGSGLSTIGLSTFNGCTALRVIKSLNPTPPSIDDSATFYRVDKEACQLIVAKGNLAYYRLCPYWKEFLNISDDLLALNPLPIMRYGEGSINLAEYVPVGVSLIYESSNSDVAKIEGTMLTICGAGEATVSASVAEEGTPMEIIGQMRTLIVDKADLTLTAESYEIEQGDPMPNFAIKYDLSLIHI